MTFVVWAERLRRRLQNDASLPFRAPPRWSPFWQVQPLVRHPPFSALNLDPFFVSTRNERTWAWRRALGVDGSRTN